MYQLILILINILFDVLIQYPVEGKENSFSADLIHYNSPLSPFYNHSITQSKLARNDALRSYNRVNFFHSSMHINEKKVMSTVFPNGGDYIMKIRIASPSVEVYALVDTGSDLIWIQCFPCRNCHKQDAPFFNPRNSHSYKRLQYDTEACRDLDGTQSRYSDNCNYTYSYLDGSETLGILSSEKFYLNSGDDEVLDLVFGCGHKNYPHDINSGVQGVIGLGGGKLSLVSQLKPHTVEHKFSYCLLPRRAKTTSKIRFGQGATIYGDDIVSTPLVDKYPPTLYYISLESISIRDNKTRKNQDAGNIFVDSGAPYTILHTSLYDDLDAIVREKIDASPASNPPKPFKLCYTTHSMIGKELPTMVFHFTNADIRLPPLNTFLAYWNLHCLAMLPSNLVSVFGNMAQVNFQVEFDLHKRKVSFGPKKCEIF